MVLEYHTGTSLDLSNNELNGELPKLLNVEIISLSSNQIHGQLPLIGSNVQELDLSNNSFVGPASTFLCSRSLGKICALIYLDLSNNLLSGDLTNDLVSSLDKLQVLDLSNNNLSGQLPSSLRKCTSLFNIDLGENRFTGVLPIWLGELNSLNFLHLRSNKFHGEIPVELCHLASIRSLDFAHNDLRGSIPRCFNNFSSIATNQLSDYYYPTYRKIKLMTKGRELKYYGETLILITNLDLSTNSLSSEIPEELTSLHWLRSLNLSRNGFTGNIPRKIGSMSSLESLDFSDNNISGVIPHSISGLTFLSCLNLSFNNLSGMIPLSTQMQSFSESSFIGNKELCGSPLIKKCNGEEPLQEPSNIGDKEVEEEDWFEDKWFYMSMGVGFAVGFLGFLGCYNFEKVMENCLFFGLRTNFIYCFNC